MRASSSQSGTSQAPTAVPPAPETLSHASPQLTLPEKFNGDPEKCKAFILQCSLYLTQQPELYTTEAGKITFVCSLLTGKALEWITAVWRGDGAVFPSFEVFLRRFKAVFEHSKEGKSAGDHLLELSQGRMTAAEYALAFRTLAAQTSWMDDTLKVIFRRGLNHALQSELACCDEVRDFDQFINLTIQIDNLIRSRRVSARTVRGPRAFVPAVTAEPEPMQVNSYHLSTDERLWSVVKLGIYVCPVLHGHAPRTRDH